MNEPLTFRDLESEQDRSLVDSGGASPLEIWYRSVRDKPVSTFSHNDLCKACRQQLFPEVIIPIAIDVLRKEPLAGEMYDGELLVAMVSVDCKYWLAHPTQALELSHIAQSVMGKVDKQLQEKLAILVAKGKMVHGVP
jgi:hypothetical protein